MTQNHGIPAQYKEMIYPDRRLTVLQLLHDEIEGMIWNLEKLCDDAKVPVDGTLAEIVADLTNASRTPGNEASIASALQTEWLCPRLLEERWDGGRDLAINPVGMNSDTWVIRSDDQLRDSLLRDKQDIEYTLQQIKEDGKVDAPLRIFPELPRLRAINTFLFDFIEQEENMYELDRLTMLVMLMRSGTIEYKRFADLKGEKNENLLLRLRSIYELVNSENRTQEKVGKRYAFKSGRKPGFLVSLITVRPGVKYFYLQDEGENQTYNIKFDHDIIMGGDQIHIPDNGMASAWDGLEGRPVTDLIDTPITRALDAEIVSITRTEGTGQITLIMNQRMKEQPLTWPEEMK